MDDEATLSDPVPLFGPEMHADPYPIYAKLRSLAPVHHSERLNCWMVTGYEEVAAGLRIGRADRLRHDPASIAESASGVRTSWSIARDSICAA
jgi:cytochrome P450